MHVTIAFVVLGFACAVPPTLTAPLYPRVNAVISGNKAGGDQTNANQASSNHEITSVIQNNVAGGIQQNYHPDDTGTPSHLESGIPPPGSHSGSVTLPSHLAPGAPPQSAAHQTALVQSRPEPSNDPAHSSQLIEYDLIEQGGEHSQITNSIANSHAQRVVDGALYYGFGVLGRPSGNKGFFIGSNFNGNVKFEIKNVPKDLWKLGGTPPNDPCTVTVHLWESDDGLLVSLRSGKVNGNYMISAGSIMREVDRLRPFAGRN